MIKHYNIIRQYYSLCYLLFDVNNYDRPTK